MSSVYPAGRIPEPYGTVGRLGSREAGKLREPPEGRPSWAPYAAVGQFSIPQPKEGGVTENPYCCQTILESGADHPFNWMLTPLGMWRSCVTAMEMLRPVIGRPVLAVGSAA